MKLDILVFAAHPDDAELGCGGTIAAHINKGFKVGIADLTRGELGTRGTPEIRNNEAIESAKTLGLSARENLKLDDGFFQNDKQSNLELIKIIRKYQPDIVLANAVHDRHTDHGKAAELANSACFLSGLAKIETSLNGEKQKPWRPKNLYHYIQDRYIAPDFVVDVSDFWEIKTKAIRAFQSQFFNPDSKEPVTYISTSDFMHFVEARGLEFGHSIGTKYGEGFTKSKQLGVTNLFDLI